MANIVPRTTDDYLALRLDGARDLYLLALALGERRGGPGTFGPMIQEARIHFAGVIEEARIAGLDTSAIGSMAPARGRSRERTGQRAAAHRVVRGRAAVTQRLGLGPGTVARRARGGTGTRRACTIYLFGPEILFRAQPYGTFTFLFNGIHLARRGAQAAPREGSQ